MILHDKKKLLSFRNSDGSYNTLRFLFSKWTLKEGWDNPNVFTIAKLRSSGSETSKLQEVGRGLRLPVDENGNRISNEQFQLNYIVDFTEADFAQKLIEQINSELVTVNTISSDNLKDVARKYGLSEESLFGKLFNKGYIDSKMNIISDNRKEFLNEYPEFEKGVEQGKILDRNINNPKAIKIRKSAYNEIKVFWEKLNQRYLLFYDKSLDVDIYKALLSILESDNLFTDLTVSSSREVIKSNGKKMSITSKSGVQYLIKKPISYNVFLKRIMEGTNIPILEIHRAISEYSNRHGNIKKEHINENTVSTIIQRFKEWKNDNLQGRFHYKKSSSSIGSTALTHADGTPRTEIAQGRIGTKFVEGTPSDNYLYDVFAYDSPLERQNIMTDIEEVTVYGKIPRSSISIPTITGGTYSPDFMYVVKKSNDEQELNLIIETKDVENKTVLRGTEKTNLECARVFFDSLTNDGYKVFFREQINNKQMLQIVKEVLKND